MIFSVLIEGWLLCGYFISTLAPPNTEFYFLLLAFFTVENTKTASETKSIIPNVLTIISGNLIVKILAPIKNNVAIPITIKLIDHIVLIIFEFISLPPQIQPFSIYLPIPYGPIYNISNMESQMR